MNGRAKRTALFSLGQTVATPGALEVIELAEETASQLLARHISGDWGEVPRKTRQKITGLSSYILLPPNYPPQLYGMKQGEVSAKSLCA